MDKKEAHKLAKQIYRDSYQIDVEVLENGYLPIKAHQTDAGIDLFVTEDVTITQGNITKHPLNIRLKLPKGTYMEITSKSGLGLKGLLVYAGIIDEEYRGIPHVICTNLTDKSIILKKGQKIAQMIPHPFSSEYYINRIDKIDLDTNRGTGGFGSSGS